MIIGVICKSVSEFGSSTFVDFEADSGMKIRIQQPSTEPVPWEFRRTYAIEIYATHETSVKAID